MSLLDERKAYKPFEYPVFNKVTKLIRKTHWIDDELNFIVDKHDFHTRLDDTEKYIIGTILKSFAQTETEVANEFWGLLKDYIPKPEFIEMAVGNAENEWRHASAYDRLSEELGLSDYTAFLEDEILKRRLENLAKIETNEDGSVQVESLATVFAIFGGCMEYTSLFAQFAIMLSFSNRGLLPDVGNIIAWSQKDEALHAMSAMYTFKLLVEEYGLDKGKLTEKIHTAFEISLKIEEDLIQQIFSKGELKNLKSVDLVEFMKWRINQALEFMELKTIYSIDMSKIANMEWFVAEYSSQEMTDFFWSRPIEYTKGETTYSAENLF